MKKVLIGILTAALLAGAMAGVTACGDNDASRQRKTETLEVVSPDGAPALSLCYAISEEDKKEDELFDFDIVNADTITTYVTGVEPKADICVLPVNIAAKVLGKGTTYQMLGTVTNGNLYLLSFGETQLTAGNLSESLLGKKLGVIQLSNVPGLTLQVVLNKMNIAYQLLDGIDAEAAADKVNLVAVTQDDVSPAGKCDFFLCPEPAASAKVKGSASSQRPLYRVGDLQALYGEEGGYPQAAVVAKKSAIENYPEHIEAFLGYLEESASYLETAEIANLLQLLEEERESGVTPSFSENNLTREVIGGCSVRFTASKLCKDRVLTFLNELIAVKADSTALPDDAFFYMG